MTLLQALQWVSIQQASPTVYSSDKSLKFAVVPDMPWLYLVPRWHPLRSPHPEVRQVGEAVNIKSFGLILPGKADLGKENSPTRF
jgi:hypothetical protein